jgi:hypothetical protein
MCHETKDVPTHHGNYSCCYLQQEVHLQVILTERTLGVVNKSALVYTYKSNLHKVSEFKLKGYLAIFWVPNWPETTRDLIQKESDFHPPSRHKK